MPHPVYEIDITRPITKNELRLTIHAATSGVAAGELFFLRVQNKFTKRPITKAQIYELTNREYIQLFDELAKAMEQLVKEFRALRVLKDYELPKGGRLM